MKNKTMKKALLLLTLSVASIANAGDTGLIPAVEGLIVSYPKTAVCTAFVTGAVVTHKSHQLGKHINKNRGKYTFGLTAIIGATGIYFATKRS